MFKVYKASAGSGKTTSLVAEYISLCLLKPDRFRHILAITFTNNATAEMKERIVNVLKVYALSQRSDYPSTEMAVYELMCKLNPAIGTLSESEFQQKAQVLLEKILYDYPDFSISTIDSFFQRVIRSFALELGLTMNFEVQVELSDYYQQTVDMLLNRLSKEKSDLANRVISLVRRQMEDSGNWKIEYVLRHSIATIENEKSFEAADKLSEMHYLRSKDNAETNGDSDLTKALKDISAAVKAKKKELQGLSEQLELIVDSLGDNPDMFKRGSTGIYKFAHTLKDDLFCTINSYVEKAVFESDSILKNPTDQSLALQPTIREIIEKIKEIRIEIANLKPIESNASLLMLLFDLKEIMDEIKLRDNLFFLSETNARIFREIKDSDTPYLFEKIGNKYSYFFIDEFQDTSKLQWENAKPLILNALSGQNPYGDGGKSILFGDVKQAIYRFRNGDSKLLNELSSADGARHNLKSDILTDADFAIQKLDTNYRSAKSIIKFNNEFFNYLIDGPLGEISELLKIYYADLEQNSPEDKKAEGFVKVRFRQEDDPEDYDFQECLKAIEDAQEKGYDYKDMAVLCKGKDKGRDIANFLASKNIPVISEDSLLISSSEDVILIINTLKYILSPGNLLAQLAIVCHFEPEKVGEFAPLLSAKSGLNGVLALLKDKFDVEQLRDIARFRSYPVFTTIKELLKIYRMEKADVYLTTFLDAVYGNFNKNFNDLTQFLTWWNESGSGLSVNSSKDANAVRISTIHKSKGLAYPLVIFPMNSWANFHGIKQLWVKNESQDCALPYFLIDTNKSQLQGTVFSDIAEEETEMSLIDNVNAVYVAHTRARDGMYIIAGNPEKSKNYSKYLGSYILQKKEETTLPKEYWFGDKDFKKKKDGKFSSKENADVNLDKLYLSDFTLQSSQLVCGPVATAEQELGIFIHDFLSHLKSFPENEQELDALLQSVESREEREILRSFMLRIVEDPELQPYFAVGAQVLNETSILNTDGRVYRPDRIVFLDDEVMVIDYKTGRENEAYQRQLDLYCNLLCQMGYANVKSRILYL